MKAGVGVVNEKDGNLPEWTVSVTLAWTRNVEEQLCVEEGGGESLPLSLD